MADDLDDLDAEFAQFEAQIQSVVSKPKTQPQQQKQQRPEHALRSPSQSQPHPHLTTCTSQIHPTSTLTRSPSAPKTSPAQTDSTNSPSLTNKQTTNAANTNPITINNNNSVPTVSGKWKWDGTKWVWHTTAPQPSALAPLHTTNHTYAPVHPSLPLPVAGPSDPLAQTKPVHKVLKRTAAGEVWRDDTLATWPENDHRIFVGDLAPDATDEELTTAFSKYASFNMARVVIDKRTEQCKGYGFVSFAAGEDMIAALKEMNGKYVGSRPVKLKKSNWQKRNLDSARRKELKLFNTIRKKKT